MTAGDVGEARESSGTDQVLSSSRLALLEVPTHWGYDSHELLNPLGTQHVINVLLLPLLTKLNQKQSPTMK